MIRLWLGLSMGRIGRPQDRVLSLSALEQEELERISRSRSAPHGVVRRAQIILGSASGESNLSIARRLGVSNPTVRHWRKRWFDQGLVGLYGEAKPGRPRTHDEERIAELLRTVLESRPADGTHWTVRSAAKTTGLSKLIARSTGRGADGSDQSVARHPAGARICCSAGQAKARAVSERTDGRARRSRPEPTNCSARRRRSRAMGRTRSTNFCLRRRVRPLGEGERRGSTADDNPRHRRDRRLRPCRRRRSGGKLRARARSRRVARLGSPSVHHRRQAEAAWHQQTRQQLPSPTADPRCTRRAAYVAERDTPLGRWAKGLSGRAHRNVAIVAFANKLARIAWAALRRGERFAVMGMPAAA